MTEYSYTPLCKGQFRLLKLFAGEQATQLEGNLVTRRLRPKYTLAKDIAAVGSSQQGHDALIDPRKKDNHETATANPDAETFVDFAEAYEALSYTWGGTPDEAPFISIIDGNHSWRIPITFNLESALRHLRYRSSSRLLWVDALCINQRDMIEKSSQIPKMFEIYNQAKSVCVWLGVEEDNSGAALTFIKRILNFAEFDQLVRDSMTSREWAAFLALMKRPWFSRRWVIQEISLARNATLFCGKDSVSWNQFAGAVSLFTSKRHDVRKLFQGSSAFHHDPDFLGEVEQSGANRLVYASSNVFRKTDDGEIMEHLLSLEALMSSLSAFSASDPRDTVYAIAQLANDARPASDKSKAFFLLEPEVDHTRVSSPAIKTTSPTQGAIGFGDNAPAKSTVTSVLMPNSKRRKFTKDLHDGGPKSEPLSDKILLVPDIVSQGHESSMSVAGLRAAAKWSKPVIEKRIVVDYEKSVYDVCKDFISFTITRSKSLDIICRPWAPDQPGLPSWLPHISAAPFRLDRHGVYRRVKADPLVGLPEMGRRPYNASGKTKAAWKFNNDGSKSLCVQGFVVDLLGVKKMPAQGGNIPYEWLETVNWCDAACPVPDRFWRTLVADRSPEGRKPSSSYIYQMACQHALLNSTEGDDIYVKDLSNRADCPSPAAEFLRRVLAVVWKRSLFLSEREKFLGLAPFEARQGDLICILFGCSVPVVLRKVFHDMAQPDNVGENAKRKQADEEPARSGSSTSDHHYQFIGECYVHSLMDGEALTLQRNRGLPQQEFELR
jgi:Heterokaryon incompatibility protein (HET)